MPFAVMLAIIIFSATVMTGRGPAPSSGDGISEGPGWSGDWINEDNPGEVPGPAPNAGDGVPDGPGW